MMARRGVLALMAGSAAVLLSGCGLMNNRASYRFRMTVEVETPNGLRTGSSVYEFIVAKNTMKLLADERSGGVLIRGEASIIELDGGPVFVTLVSPDAEVSLGRGATDALLATLPNDGGDDYIAAVDKLGGWFADPASAELPREKWPLMVRFDNVNDPASAQPVNPDVIGVKRILIETTRDEVTVGIRERLGWLYKDLPNGNVISDPTKNPKFKMTLRKYDFDSELL